MSKFKIAIITGSILIIVGIVGVIPSGLNMTKEVFRFVPQIKYNPNSDLFKLYEIEKYKPFIDSVIKPINER